MSDPREMPEVASLVRRTGASIAECKLLRQMILDSGRSVQEFLLDERMPGMPSSKTLFTAARELIKLAGSSQRAVEAVQAVAGAMSSDGE